jgi:hypothetical protein
MTSYFKFEELPKKKTMVKTVREFAFIPVDTFGFVYGYYKHDKDTYGVDIRWQRWVDDRLTDGFSKSEYKRYLIEMG